MTNSNNITTKNMITTQNPNNNEYSKVRFQKNAHSLHGIMISQCLKNINPHIDRPSMYQTSANFWMSKPKSNQEQKITCFSILTDADNFGLPNQEFTIEHIRHTITLDNIRRTFDKN